MSSSFSAVLLPFWIIGAPLVFAIFDLMRTRQRRL